MRKEALVCYIGESQYHPYHPPWLQWGMFAGIRGKFVAIRNDQQSDLQHIPLDQVWFVKSEDRQYVDEAYEAFWDANGTFGRFIESQQLYATAYQKSSKTRRRLSMPLTPTAVRAPLFAERLKPYPLWHVVEPIRVHLSHQKPNGIWIRENGGMRRVAMDTLYCCASDISWKFIGRNHQAALEARSAWLHALDRCLWLADWIPHQLSLWPETEASRHNA